jgi:hypothetical protein
VHVHIVVRDGYRRYEMDNVMKLCVRASTCDAMTTSLAGMSDFVSPRLSSFFVLILTTLTMASTRDVLVHILYDARKCFSYLGVLENEHGAISRR